VLGLSDARKMTTELQIGSWEVRDRALSFNVKPALKATLGEPVGQKTHRCPACNSIIYSRRHRLCGVCGSSLPEDRLFTPTEAKAVTRLLSVEKQRHRQWLSKGFAQALSVLI
jgi:hypothetical protein